MIILDTRGAYLLQDDVDVAGNQLGNLLSLSRLDRVVLLRVVAKVEGERVRAGAPPLHGSQRPRLQNLLRLLVQSKYRVLGDSEQARHKLVLSLLLFLNKKRKEKRVRYIQLIMKPEQYIFSFGRLMNQCLHYGNK